MNLISSAEGGQIDKGIGERIDDVQTQPPQPRQQWQQHQYPRQQRDEGGQWQTLIFSTPDMRPEDKFKWIIKAAHTHREHRIVSKIRGNNVVMLVCGDRAVKFYTEMEQEYEGKRFNLLNAGIQLISSILKPTPRSFGPSATRDLGEYQRTKQLQCGWES